MGHVNFSPFPAVILFLSLKVQIKEFLAKKAGFTQGDSLAIQRYAAGQLPLIKKLKNPEKWYKYGLQMTLLVQENYNYF